MIELKTYLKRLMILKIDKKALNIIINKNKTCGSREYLKSTLNKVELFYY